MSNLLAIFENLLRCMETAEPGATAKLFYQHIVESEFVIAEIWRTGSEIIAHKEERTIFGVWSYASSEEYQFMNFDETNEHIVFSHRAKSDPTVYEPTGILTEEKFKNLLGIKTEEQEEEINTCLLAELIKFI